MQLSYLDFELEIGMGQGRDFPVVAHSPAGEARTIMRLPYDELALENRLKDLQIALLRSGGQRRQVLSSEQQAVRSFGQALFDALITGEVRSRFDVSLQQARSQGKGLRIRLQAQAPAVAALPWEYLYDPRQAEYCALSLETPVVRYIELSQSLAPLAVAPPLRILAMVPSPSDLATLDVAQEKQRIEQALQGLRAQGRVDVQWLPGQTWRHLQEALRRGPWHIFHFSGHGRFDALTDEGQLIFADDRDRAHPMPASDIGRLLANHRSLRLAWLNACEGARGGEADIFSSAASILVRRGIPAVVAMQHEITDRAAIELARSFYGALADGYPVDAALAEARVATSVAVNNTVEWGTPVLYMRAPDGVLFDVATRAGEAQPHTEAPAPIEAVAVSLPKASQTQLEEMAPLTAPVEPVAMHKLSQRFLSRVLLPIVALVVAIGVIVLIARAAGLFSGVSLPETTETATAQGSSPVAAVSSGVATTTPTGTPQPSTLSALSDKIVFTEQGATVTDPVYMELVRVPAGEFLMGSDPTKDSEAMEVELPQHRVELAEYFIGKYEMTNAQYAAFVGATGHSAPPHWENQTVPIGKEDHPVVNVSWDDAVAFAEWLSSETGAAFRLPSEAEWEKACRGPNGLIYPWGDSAPDEGKLNYAGNVVILNPGGKPGNTTPIGSYSPDGDSPYGAADMAGNVAEWVADWYGWDYYAASPTENPLGPGRGDRRGVRGGYFDSFAWVVRCTVRDMFNPLNRDERFGFRLAMDWAIDPTSLITDVTSSATTTTHLPILTAQPDKVVETETGASIINPIRMELVRVPAGEFVMGSDSAEDPAAGEDETPQHQVSLAKFDIGKYEVTNAQYAAFISATGHHAPIDWEDGSVPVGKEDHPVVYVSWYDATAFMEWLSEETGKTFRLPTEAEWEKACRGTDGRIYPWGNAFDASKANTIESDLKATTEVGRYTLAGGDSLYEMTDMAGNVWEWTNSQYWGFGYPYVPSDGRENMSSSDSRTLRGGSFNESAAGVRCAVRHGYGAEFDSQHYGFRVVMDSP